MIPCRESAKGHRQAGWPGRPAGWPGRRLAGCLAIQRSPAVQPPSQPVGLSATQRATCPAPEAAPRPWSQHPGLVARGYACILPSHVGSVPSNLTANLWPIKVLAVLCGKCVCR